MSKYTTELRYLVEGGYDLGMQEYPCISEEYRTQLNNKIIQHYYFDEIGYETASMFKHHLNEKLNLEMVYFNKLLQSELLNINPLLSFSRSRSEIRDKDSQSNQVRDKDSNNNQTINNSTSLDNTTTENTTNTRGVTTETQKDSTEFNNSKNEFYDTPMGSVGDITNDYVTNLTKNYNDGVMGESESNISNENVTGETSNVVETQTQSNTTNNSSVAEDEIINSTMAEDETITVTENGHEVSQTELLQRYRETFLNVDKLIIDSLKECFMLVY